MNGKILDLTAYTASLVKFYEKRTQEVTVASLARRVHIALVCFSNLGELSVAAGRLDAGGRAGRLLVVLGLVIAYEP